MKPKISIVVPNYNHAAYLEERLESIFNQTFEDYEVILLDDSSTDNSAEILKKYACHPKVTHCIINEENSGGTFIQWNKGIELAKGEFIWIAETDDYCEFDFLERMLAFYGQNREVSLLYSQSHRVNSQGRITGNWVTHTSNFHPNIFDKDFVMEGNLFIEKYLIHKNVIPNVSAVLFKRTELERIFPLRFYPYMKYNADWFYYVQLLCNTQVGYVSDSLNYFRYHNSSVISSASKQKSWWKIFKMEALMRKKMFQYLKSCNPPNIEKIKVQKRKGDVHLRFLTANGYIKKKKYGIGIWIALREPHLWSKIFRSII